MKPVVSCSAGETLLSMLASCRTMERPTRVLFVCHGNICRSPMAEFILKDLARRTGAGGSLVVESCATSSEELGNPIYPPAANVLREHGVPYDARCARRMRSEDYDDFDLIVAMDRSNIRNMKDRTRGDPDGKVRMMMSFAGSDADVSDPWYTGDYEGVYRCIEKACMGMLRELTHSDVVNG